MEHEHYAVIKIPALLHPLLFLAPAIGATLPAPAQSTQENLRQTFTTAARGSWEETFADPGTGKWQEQWFLDGKVGTVRNSAQGMTLAAGPEFRNDVYMANPDLPPITEGRIGLRHIYTRSARYANFRILVPETPSDGCDPQ